MFVSPSGRAAVLAALVAVMAGPANAQTAAPITVPGERAFPESITATPDGTLYVSSLAEGGIRRVKPGATSADEFVAPGAYATRSTFGLYADVERNTLWACSNDASALGVPGPGSATGSHLVAFDLTSGEGKASYKFPGTATLCNDMTVADDGSIYVTNTLTPQIFRLKPGATELELFIEDKQLQPAQGAGLDGIAFGADGHLYVNTYNGGDLFRIEVKDAQAGRITKLATSRPLSLPDGLRRLEGQTFLMAEGSGTLDRVTIDGDRALVETVKDHLNGPVAFAKVGRIVWVAEGQLSHLFAAKENGPPRLPFQLVPVQYGN